MIAQLQPLAMKECISATLTVSMNLKGLIGLWENKFHQDIRRYSAIARYRALTAKIAQCLPFAGLHWPELII